MLTTTGKSITDWFVVFSICCFNALTYSASNSTLNSLTEEIALNLLIAKSISEFAYKDNWQVENATLVPTAKTGPL